MLPTGIIILLFIYPTAAISCRCFLDSCPISRTGRTKLTDNAHFIIINDYLSIA